MIAVNGAGILEWILQHMEILLAGLSVIAFVGICLALRRERKRSLARDRQLTKALENAQRRLRSSISDTRSLLNQEASIIMVFDRHSLTLMFANQQALDLFGCGNSAELSDKVLMRPDAWQPHPYSLLDFEEWMGGLKASGSQSKEWLFNDQDSQGVWADCFVGNTVFEGKAARILSANNIHRYKMDRIADTLRNRVLTGINTGAPLEKVFDSLCKIAEIRFRDSHCLMSLFDQQRDQLVSVGSSVFAKKWREKIPVVKARYGETSIGTAAYTLNRVICEVIADDHRWQGYAQFAAELGVRTVWSEPVIDQKGNLLGVFSAFSITPRKPDDVALADLASIVSLAGLAVERHQWRENLEAAFSSERLLRELGVELVNLTPGAAFKAKLRSVLHRIAAHYELGSIGIWEHCTESKSFAPLVFTSKNLDVASEDLQNDQKVPQQVVKDWLGEDASWQVENYATHQDRLHGYICMGDEPKPVLVMPLAPIDLEQSLIGFVAIQSQFVYLAQDVIEHLRVIGTLVRTVLLNRRLVESLSNAMENEQFERRKLEGELSVARSIQMAMVPGGGQFKETYRNWTIEAWLQPAKAVGGDLYEFIRLPSGKALIAVGDVSDKGAPAALFMAKTVSLLNLLARARDGDLNAIAEELNDELCRSNDSCMFVTMILCTIDLKTGHTVWLNAGHNQPLGINGIAAPEYYDFDAGPPLGLYEGTSYSVVTSRIDPGQRIALYSDGVTEAFNDAGEEFGDDRFLSLGFRAEGRTEPLLGFMREQLKDFIGNAPQSDDITMLTIHHHGQAL
ncbi:MAG: sigma-B regulation protein RsbU (phosphoserine phosphatase) [Marinobacter excellens HL-55]|uniref:Sigma-B regulation protein RsbU (Phosphoserine phosphatase) n=1 Tax=Marinobacter excellens HL-55 TaxID=1305731 RepID=A0A0N8KKU9_9GAMM|nr:MAG: sigma-B regulation protein RsbU (phosphoserine phosphatase) [Marinobacter excellens HL-55]